MALRKFQFALAEIADEIAWVQNVLKGKTFDDFQEDRALRYAVERSIEIISEASRRIPDDLKASQPQIKWKAIAGIGNMMRHEYHSTSSVIVWNAVFEEFPPLDLAIHAMIASTKEGE